MELHGVKIAVTGGAGFIGSHVVDALLARGSEVVAIDDFSTGTRENLAHHDGNARLHVEEASVLDEPAMHRLLRGAACVLHLATRSVRVSLKRPTAVHEVNTTGTLNVLKAAAAARAKRFLYCSSSEVIGTAGVVPITEDYVFRPETIYGASKLAGEYYAQVFNRSGWLPTVIARPFNTYGPREYFEGSKGEVIPRFIMQALSGRALTVYGDGLQTRDFIYVSETADYLVRLAGHAGAVGATFNVCRGEEITIRDVAARIAELVGVDVSIRHLPARPSDVLRLYGSNDRLSRLLGDAPSVSMRAGLARTIDWFRSRAPVAMQGLGFLDADNWSAQEGEAWMERAAAPD